MPTLNVRKKAGIKAVRQNVKRTALNKLRVGSIEIQERLLEHAILAKNTETIKKIQIILQKLNDKAVKHNVIHAHTAGRRKSRLAKRLQLLKTE